MPTGYTAGIQEGISFKQYIMNCAKAFGALIDMRDEPFDAKIPEKLEPSDYHQKELKKLALELDLLLAMTIEEAETNSHEDFTKKKAYYSTQIIKCNEIRLKYQAMTEQVKKWIPPTPEHNHLKEFMLQQIERSKGDGDTSYNVQALSILKELSGEEWIECKIIRIAKDARYHRKNYKEELDRIENKNKWIQDLRDSIK